MGSARRRATYDDLVKVPEPLVAELIEGDLITSPRPAFPHALVASALSMELAPLHGLPAQGRLGGWWILYEPELHLGEDVLVPDLAGWRQARMPVFPDVAASDHAPDWVCEVVSPTTGYLDRSRKMPIHARERVRHLWLIDPGTRTLEVYRLEASGWLAVATHGGSTTVRAEPFDALEIDLRRLWGEA